MPIQDLAPMELRRYMETHKEVQYRLIDVRQPGEYQEAHIPGALLIPLPSLTQDMADLPADKELIFYCRSGSRSAAAAVMVDEESSARGPLYNLAGGILAWDGATLEDIPKVALFDHQSAAEMMVTAMDLEKGALRFYTRVQETFSEESWSAVFGRLATMEIAHAKTVYAFWKNTAASVEDFDNLFEKLSGEVLEGGRPLNEVLAIMERKGARSCLDLVELALNIEYSAYDLYRTMADHTPEKQARDAFLTIAQAEKGHMQTLIKAIEECG
jgi:rhodanese-related sulfurtransferase/rubrerythrin